ncbi:MAG: sugar-transfer associated ATP-grasp domain-containing protein, partial [Sphingomicrobium sp.]
KLLLQPRVINHPSLARISNGALSTVRVLTCLDEDGRPEAISAMLRMAIADNHVVDNAHKGGIAAAIDLETGILAEASDFGAGANWLARHPTSDARIAGTQLPYWDRLRPFVEHAHSTVPDRMLIGWDVAITPGGLVLIEANGSPGLEMMQRVHRRGFIRDRLGQLLAYHLQPSGPAALAA